MFAAKLEAARAKVLNVRPGEGSENRLCCPPGGMRLPDGTIDLTSDGNEMMLLSGNSICD